MKVVWSREAMLPKDEIWHFHADHDVRYVEKVEARIEARGAGLASVPHQGRPIDPPGLRQFSIPDTQYVLSYRIEEETVYILHLWNTAQDRSG